MKKKSIFLAALAATAMLTGCSNDETTQVAQNGRAIQFDGFVNKSTRADLTTDNIESFQVWGLMSNDEQNGTPFIGTTVTKGESGDWTYSPLVYWSQGYKYSFVAIAPASDDSWSFSAPSTVGQWGTIDFTNNGETDLIYALDGTYATTPLATSQGQTISLTFNHLLSRVKFVFKNSMEDDSKLTISDVTIKAGNKAATATLGQTSTWAIDAGTPATDLVFGETGAISVNSNDETAAKYMIPLDGQTYTATFTVKREHSGITDTYSHTVTLPSITWQQGYSYALTAELTAENVDPKTDLYPIVFDVTEVEDWEDYTDETVDVPSVGN